jgi:hypothetical protein
VQNPGNGARIELAAPDHRVQATCSASLRKRLTRNGQAAIFEGQVMDYSNVIESFLNGRVTILVGDISQQQVDQLYPDGRWRC